VQADPQDDVFYQALNNKISGLPPQAQQDTVFRLFSVSLKMMDRATVLNLRAELHERFPQKPDQRDLGTMLIEIVEGHLALRDLTGKE
jgi:hypothetical protein